jgi:2'-5' RNA ligase
VLYVVAWPVLSETDDTALRRLRAQYHPREADLIGPHFTLVFGAADEMAPALQTALDGIARRPFWFMIDRIVRDGEYLFAEPSDGAAELIELYELLNAEPVDIPFQPHITLGMFERPAEAERVARIVERQHLPLRGRIEELALLRREGSTLAPVANYPLQG